MKEGELFILCGHKYKHGELHEAVIFLSFNLDENLFRFTLTRDFA